MKQSCRKLKEHAESTNKKTVVYVTKNVFVDSGTFSFTSKTRNHSSRMHTTRFLWFRGGVGWGIPPWIPYSLIPYTPDNTRIPHPLDTLPQISYPWIPYTHRYPPQDIIPYLKGYGTRNTLLSRKDMGPELPNPFVKRMTDRRPLKHYLPVSSVNWPITPFVIQMLLVLSGYMNHEFQFVFNKGRCAAFTHSMVTCILF